MNELEKDEERVLDFIRNQLRDNIPKKDISKYEYYILKITDLSEQYWEKYFNDYYCSLSSILYIIRNQKNLLKEFYEKKLTGLFSSPNIWYNKTVVLINLLQYNKLSEDYIRKHPEIFDEEFWRKVHG